MGYNYEWNSLVEIPMVKQVLYNIEKEYYLEIAMISLFDFPDSLVQKMVGGNNKHE